MDAKRFNDKLCPMCGQGLIMRHPPEGRWVIEHECKDFKLRMHSAPGDFDEVQDRVDVWNGAVDVLAYAKAKGIKSDKSLVPTLPLPGQIWATPDEVGRRYVKVLAVAKGKVRVIAVTKITDSWTEMRNPVWMQANRFNGRKHGYAFHAYADK